MGRKEYQAFHKVLLFAPVVIDWRTENVATAIMMMVCSHNSEIFTRKAVGAGYQPCSKESLISLERMGE